MRHSRGLVVGLTAGLLSVTALTAPALAETEITFFMWAGSNQGVVPTEVIDEYLANHDDVKINILESNNTITYPKMVAARRTTPDDPLVHCGFFNVDSMNKGDVDDMWESLNPERIPNMANVLDNFRRPNDLGIGYQTLGIGLIYNTDQVKEPPTSWSDLWSPDFQDRVVMFDYDTRALAMAARLNGGDEHDIDPGFETWAENAQNLRALVDSNDALKNLLVSGDAWIAPWFSPIASIWMEEGAPLGFAVPKEGAIAFPIYLTIGAGVDDAERAVCEDLVNELLSPERAGRYGDLTRSIPVINNAVLTERQKTDPLLGLGMAESAVHLDYAHIAEMSADWRERWDREVKFKLR